MTHRTRNFLVGSSLITAVGLCTGLVAYYNGALPLRGAALGPAELSYMPADVSVLAYADVRHIMGSAFRQKLRDVMPSGKEKDRLLEETGVDIERDVDTVVAGVSSADPANSGGVVLMRGRFNVADVERRAVGRGAKVQEYAGKRLLVMPIASAETSAVEGPVRAPDAGRVDRMAAIAFLESGLIALGDDISVKRAIDTAAAGTDVTTNDSVMKLVAGVSASGDAWAVSRIDAASNAGGLPEQLRGQLSGVQWFSIAAKIDRNVQGRVMAEANDDKSGEELRAVVNGAVAAAKMVAGGKDKTFDGLLNSLTATGSGRSIELSFTVPIEMLDTVSPSSLGSMIPSLQ